jgi:hypothetical protein
MSINGQSIYVNCQLMLEPIGWMTQGILYTWGRGWYRMCCRQPTVGLAVSKIKQNIFSAQTATF